MTKNKIEVGEVFSYWKVVEKQPRGSWLCLCLGCSIQTRVIRSFELVNGKRKSCGCKMKEVIRKTNLEKYGVEWTQQNQKIKQKSKETCIERYGVDNYGKSSERVDKIRQTCIKKYGVSSPRQLKSVKDKQKQTLLNRYGVENPGQILDHQEKTKNTNLEKYGVENFSQLPDQRLLLKEWCSENAVSYSSKGELEILEWIRSFDLPATKYKTNLELDIFIPSLNLGIEYNGLYRHSELQKATNYHLNKTIFFKDINIRTIHVWEHEWKYKQEQVKSFLLSAIGKNEHKIGARKCKVIWSDSKEEIAKAHQLLDSTHIQGCTNSTKYVSNVYYNNELIATATFGRHHRDSATWVLSRFTTKTNYTIQGILSKISKLASKELESDIISWADYRLSNGNGYEKAGWIQEKLLRPDYFYWKLSNVTKTSIISKQSRQKKSMKTPEGMTEHEHAKLDGLVRIYDCGKIRFRYKFLK
jgi:hypothetical protein